MSRSEYEVILKEKDAMKELQIKNEEEIAHLVKSSLIQKNLIYLLNTAYSNRKFKQKFKP